MWLSYRKTRHFLELRRHRLVGKRENRAEAQHCQRVRAVHGGRVAIDAADGKAAAGIEDVGGNALERSVDHRKTTIDPDVPPQAVVLQAAHADQCVELRCEAPAPRQAAGPVPQGDRRRCLVKRTPLLGPLLSHALATNGQAATTSTATCAIPTVTAIRIDRRASAASARLPSATPNKLMGSRKP